MRLRKSAARQTFETALERPDLVNFGAVASDAQNPGLIGRVYRHRSYVRSIPHLRTSTRTFQALILPHSER